MKTISTFLIGIISICILPITTYAGPSHVSYFNDVYVTDVFSGYINRLAAQDIINTENTYFRPTEHITRGETVAMLHKATNFEVDTSCDHRFEDIGVTHPFYNSIQTFVCKGFIAPNNLFNAESFITRGQFAKIAVEALDMPIDTSLGPSFYDVDANNSFYIYIESIEVASVGSGYHDGTFRANNFVQRREAAKLSVHFFDEIQT